MSEEKKTEEQSQPQYLTAEEVNKIVHGAMSSHKERLLKSAVEIAMETLRAQSKPAAEEVDESEKPKGPLASRLAAVENELKAEREKLKGERDMRQREERRRTLTDSLRAHGIDGGRLKGSLAMLEGAVSHAADGRVVAKTQREGYEEEVEVATYVEQWIKTPEGRDMLPPRGVSGSGSSQSKQAGQVSNGKQVSKADVGAMLGGLLSGQGSGDQ